MDRNKIYELVLFNVKNGSSEKYKSVYDYYYGKLKSFAGFNSIETYHNCTNETQYFDLGNWNSLEDAQTALQLLNADTEFKGFLGLLEESVFFHHAEMIAETFTETHTINSDSHLTVYNVNPENYPEFLKQREIFYNILKTKMPGFQGIYTFRSLKDKSWFADLSFCRDIKKVMEKEKELNNIPEAEKFMKCLGEIKHCFGIKRFK